MECPVSEFPHVTNLKLSERIEFPDEVVGKVTGEIPNWISGSWYRNGPGVIHFKDESVDHWFDGMALVRKFSISKGGVTYRSRLLLGDSLQKNRDAGRVVVAEFGTKVQTAAEQGFFDKLKNILSLPELTDNCLINFLVVGKNIFAITESNFIRKINANSLETEEKVDLAQYLPINIMSSHPLVDPDDGSVYMFSSSIFSKGRTRYNLLKIPKASKEETYDSALSKSKHLCSLDSSWRVSPSYHHSFAMTENFAVFVEMPLKIDIPKMSVAHLRHMSYSECIEFLPDTQTHIFLVNKSSGKKYPILYKTDPFIVYHHINAYEEDGHVVLDLCGYKKDGFYDKFLMKNLNQPPDEYMKQFSSEDLVVRVIRTVLPLVEGKSMNSSGNNLVTLPGTSCTAEMSKDGKIVYCKYEELIRGTECASISNNHTGKKYKYFYSNGGLLLPPGEKLLKVDVEAKSFSHSWQEKGCWVSQPQFVARPDGKTEDEGVLLSSVTCENGNPFLLILDAVDFKELARVHFDANLPPDLHGVYIADDV